MFGEAAGEGPPEGVATTTSNLCTKFIRSYRRIAAATAGSNYAV